MNLKPIESILYCYSKQFRRVDKTTKDEKRWNETEDETEDRDKRKETHVQTNETKIGIFCKIVNDSEISNERNKTEEKKTNEKVPFWVHWLNYQDSTKKGGENKNLKEKNTVFGFIWSRKIKSNWQRGVR